MTFDYLMDSSLFCAQLTKSHAHKAKYVPQIKCHSNLHAHNYYAQIIVSAVSISLFFLIQRLWKKIILLAPPFIARFDLKFQSEHEAGKIYSNWYQLRAVPVHQPNGWFPFVINEYDYARFFMMRNEMLIVFQAKIKRYSMSYCVKE